METHRAPQRRLFSGLVAQVTMLAGSAAIGQLLLILASPILTRLFSPAEFGTYTLFTAAVTIITIVSSLRYELAIPLSRSHSASAHVMSIAFGALVFCTLATGAASLLFREKAQQIFDIGTELFFWLLPLAVLLAGTQQILSNWAIRHQRFGIVTRSRLSQSFVAVATQLGTGALQNSNGLLTGQTVGYLAGSIGLGLKLVPEFAAHRHRISSRRLRTFAMRYRRFPLYSTWSGLSTSIGIYAPVIILTAAFGPAIAGLYGLATRVLQMPMVVLGSALSQVFFSHVARESSVSERATLIASVFQKLLRIGSGPLMVIAFLAPDVFALIFGVGWYDAGLYARWLAPLSLLVFIASPLSVMPSVLEQQRAELVFQALLLAVRIGALIVGIVLNSPVLAVATFSAASCLWWIVYLTWNFSASSVDPLAMLRTATGELLLAVVASAPALLGVLLKGVWPTPVCVALIIVGTVLAAVLATSTALARVRR